MLMWERYDERWEWCELWRALLAAWRVVMLRVVVGRRASPR